MIFRFNLEKAVFKLTQNLTSRLQFHDFLFSGGVVSSCSWWRSHYCLCLVPLTFYLFRLMFLVYISQGPIHVWNYGDCSGVNPVELSMALFGVFRGAGLLLVTFYAVLLMFSATCQCLLLWFANVSIIPWKIQLVHSRMTIR